LRESVFSVTRSTCQVSKAWVSISNLDSRLQPVRWAERASQVLPISATVGIASGRGVVRPGGQDGGQDQWSRSRKRVEPTMACRGRS
jgi:hypothetical protein